MTQQEKELLLKDLSARLPYGVKVQVADNKTPVELSCIDTKNGNGRKPYCFVFSFEPERVKPYLRPMSSMTEEEKKMFKKLNEEVFMGSMPYINASTSFYDWLNANHFDYRGLIPMGLAIEAPEGMYNLKEK